MLIRVGNTAEEQRQKHFKHAISDPLVSMYVHDRPGYKRISILPVCPRCERIGLRDKGWNESMKMTCPHCGYSGPTDIIYNEYAKEQKFL